MSFLEICGNSWPDGSQTTKFALKPEEVLKDLGGQRLPESGV